MMEVVERWLHFTEIGRSEVRPRQTGKGNRECVCGGGGGEQSYYNCRYMDVIEKKGHECKGVYGDGGTYNVHEVCYEYI